MIKDFLNLFGNMIIMIGIIMASFLLLINLYHYRDVSHTYSVDFDNNSNVVEMKKNIEKSEKLLSKSNTSSVATSVKGSIDKCIATFKNSDIYKNSGAVNYKYYNSYNDNHYMYSDINRECNALLNSNLKIQVVLDNSVNKSYGSMYSVYEKNFNYAYSNAEYLYNKSLNTNSYSFSSDINKLTVFDDLKNDFVLTVNNYKNVSSLILDLAIWYSSTFGGVSNE